MDSKYFYYFKRVAEAEHITKAAQDLYVSQAHLSRIINAIESEVGVPLFDRQGRGITLNESGKVFYKYAVRMMALYQEACSRARETHSDELFQVTLGTNAGAYLPPIITHMSAELPEIKIKQSSGPRKSLLSMVHTGNASFIITCPPVYEIGLKTEVLFDETPVVIYPDRHWLNGKKTVSLMELESEPFVGVSRGYGARDGVDDLLQKHGVNPVFAVETGDSTQVFTYVKAGLGIALSPKSLVVSDPFFSLHYAALEENTHCYLGLTWNENHRFSEYDEALYKRIVAHFRQFEMRNDEERASVKEE